MTATTEELALRLATDGFRAGDFLSLKEGIVIVEPIRSADSTASGLQLPGEVKAVPGVGCMIFRVLAHGERTPFTVQLARGDIVVLRNAHLDPLDAEQRTLSIKDEHILGVVLP
jgi:co-chaperonin GroES (HSP10)